MSRRSPLRWVGGKAWLAEEATFEIGHLLARAPRARFFEPFLGSAAVALELLAHRPQLKSVLSDVNESLIGFWQAVQLYPGPLSHAVASAITHYGIDEDGYYAMRDAYNALRPRIGIKSSALFFCLNKLGFNGIYRENADGAYNVPCGKKKAFGWGGLDEFKALSRTLAGAKLHASDWRPRVAEAGRGDVLYCDPPYDGTFDDYAAGGFALTDQIELAAQLRGAADRGVHVLANNADTPRVRELYTWADIEDVDERRSVAADGKRRGSASCLVIRSPDAAALRAVASTGS